MDAIVNSLSEKTASRKNVGYNLSLLPTTG